MNIVVINVFRKTEIFRSASNLESDFYIPYILFPTAKSA